MTTHDRGLRWKERVTLEESIHDIRRALRVGSRKGIVVGVSGGVDSAVCASLAHKALGSRVQLVFIPDRDTGPESRALAQEVADNLGLPLRERDISAAIQGLGVYDELDRKVCGTLGLRPASLQSWKLIRTPPREDLPMRWIIAGAKLGDGREVTSPALRPADLAFIVSRMNFKQRIRMAMLYSIADELGYMVLGTANFTELRTGFFVKYGDGSADCFPISRLFKTDVRHLARELCLPSAVAERVSTSDTYSGSQTQSEFFFGLPERSFDLVLSGYVMRTPAEEVGDVAGITADVARATYADLERREVYLAYLLNNSLEGIVS